MGEFELLARIRERLPAAGARVRLGSGDDAAVTVPDGATATSVDALVEGVHFRRDQASLAQIGRKALATALSDLAAMGAEPGEAYVVLGVPADLGEDGCIELLDGMGELAAATGTTLAGGDLTRAPALLVTTTVVGHAAAPELLVTRGGARPGDALALTGEIGGAAAGLLLLERREEGARTRKRGARSSFHPHSGTKGDRAPEPAADFGNAGAGLIARQLEPHPRLEAGRRLAAAGATAMIDLSDGLGGDARRLAEASGAGLRIDAGALPVAAGVAELAAAAGRDALQLAVSGGEDYELLAAIPPERLEEATAALAAVEPGGLALTRIGEVVEGGEVEIRLPGGGTLRAAGFDQLA
jgi:thiamine-monophosphate kinase